MRTIETTLYKFEELDENAQTKVLEWFAQSNQECFEPSDLTEAFKFHLEEVGFPTETVEWSLGHSQGDGVAFYGAIDVPQHLKANKQTTKFRSLFKHELEVEFGVVHNEWGTHYSHYNTMTVEGDVTHSYRELTTNEFDLSLALEMQLKDDVVEMSHKLEKIGYAELEWVASEEYIKNQIEANEHEFTAEGKLA